MAVNDRGNIRRRLAVLLASVAVCVNGMQPLPARAQESNSGLPSSLTDDDAKMLLRANELVYNRDAEKVTASGGVQIYYNRYRMVAQRVEYNQQSGRVIARGNIELIEPDGNRIYADELDVTDDGVAITATVRTTGRTGVEMEALTSVSVAALTVVDMIKAVDKHAVISDVRVRAKSGGKSGDWSA